MVGSQPNKREALWQRLLSLFPMKPAWIQLDVLLPVNPAEPVAETVGSVLPGRWAIGQTLGISSRYSQLRQHKLRLYVPAPKTYLQPKGFSP